MSQVSEYVRRARNADKLQGVIPTTFGLSILNSAAASDGRQYLELGGLATIQLADIATAFGQEWMLREGVPEARTILGLAFDGDVQFNALEVADDPYDEATWDINYTVPTKNALRAPIQSIASKLAADNNLSDLGSASAARTNLGLVIGTNVLAPNGSGASLTGVLVSSGALGNPTSGTLTNCTGLPISSGVSGLGTGVATWLNAPSSTNLLAALTTKTGTGLNVFDTSPTINTTLTVTGGTITANAPVLNATQTWNSSGVTFTGFKGVFTSTAAASGSLLLDLQSGSSPASMFSVRKDGRVTAAAEFLSIAGQYYFGSGGNLGDIYMPSAGVLRLADSTGSSFNRLQFGGTTTSYPAIKRSGTELQVRLADDSAFTMIGMLGIDGGASKTLTESTSTAFVRIACASNSYVCGVVHYAIRANDGTDYQIRSGSVNFAITNKAGTMGAALGTVINETVQATAGTLTVAFDSLAATAAMDIRASAVSSLTQTTLAMDYRVEIFGTATTITPQ